MIKSAAIKAQDKIYTGSSHGDIISNHLELIPDIITKGFATENGEFLDRYEAYNHAVECGQIKPEDCPNKMLYSYHLK